MEQCRWQFNIELFGALDALTFDVFGDCVVDRAWAHASGNCDLNVLDCLALEFELFGGCMLERVWAHLVCNWALIPECLGRWGLNCLAVAWWNACGAMLLANGAGLRCNV